VLLLLCCVYRRRWVRMEIESIESADLVDAVSVGPADAECVAGREEFGSLSDRIDAMCVLLTQRLVDRYPHLAANPPRFVPEYDRAKLFVRVVVVNDDSSSVHAFVDTRTGCLIKPATWRAPQKDRAGNLAVRFNMLDDDDYRTLLEVCDPNGAHLYRR
jgi:hypothetical protein